MSEWKRNCPKCKRMLYYSTNKNLIRATKNNTTCRSCAISGENHPMFGKKHKIETIEKNRISNIKTNNTQDMKKLHKNISINWYKNNEHSMKGINGNNHFNFGRKMTDEQRKKLSVSTKTRYKNKNERVKTSISLSGRTVSINTKKKMRLSAIKRIEDRYGMAIPNYNKNAILIIEAKAKELGITDLQHAENGGEFHIKELGYWVDGYSEEKNIVIEYYEPFHEKQIERDKRRKTEIINYLGCEFIEIKEETNES